VLERLLRICYPVDAPDLPSVAETAEVAAAAIKYEMDVAIQSTTRCLSARSVFKSLAVFVAASRLGLDKLAKDSARLLRTSRMDPVDKFLPEMRHLTAGQYFRLLKYRTDPQDLPSHLSTPPQTVQTGAAIGLGSAHELSSLVSAISLSGGRIATLQSSDGLKFNVLEALLTVASSVPPATWPRKQADVLDPWGNRTIFLYEDSHVLRNILQLIHPVPEPSVDIPAVAELYAAGVAYGFKKVEEFAQRKLMEKLETDALRVFLIAARHGWTYGAEEAVRRAIYTPIDSFLPEMENVSAQAYYDFLSYRKQCRQCAANLTSATFPSSAPSSSSTSAPALSMFGSAPSFSFGGTGALLPPSDPLFWQETKSSRLRPDLMMAVCPVLTLKAESNRARDELLKTIQDCQGSVSDTAANLQYILSQWDQLESQLREQIAKIKFKLST